MKISLKAYGKINIGLDVMGRRGDGYHLLKTIFQSVDVYDEIDMSFDEAKREASEKTLEICLKIDNAEVTDNEENLAYKAAKLFAEETLTFGSLNIRIKKNIPPEAGMGGGSSDAAAVLRGLRQLLNKQDISDEDMDNMALRLGADVPFCLRTGTWFAEGIGEKLTRLKPIDKGWLVVVKPNFGISTKRAFQILDEMPEVIHPDMDEVVKRINSGDIFGAAERMKNVLETPAILTHPEIAEIKEALLKSGARGAIMTGSGAAVFGIFEDEFTARRASNAVLTENKTEKVFVVKLGTLSA